MMVMMMPMMVRDDHVGTTIIMVAGAYPHSYNYLVRMQGCHT